MHIDPWILTFSLLTVAVTIGLGFWSARKSRTASDFFVAGRSVSVGWNASAISGEYLSAASFMGIAGMVMKNGYDALWYPVCYACGYLFLLLFIAGPLRRFGAYTIPDFAEGRYDSPVFRKIAVVFVLFIGFFYTMPQMKGAGTTLAYIFPGLNYRWGVILVGAVITLNVALGGMKGITLVQAFQYWIKMFAISVPVFVLMTIYGQYGKHVEMNTPGIAAHQIVAERAPLPDKAPVDAAWVNPFGPLTTKAAKAANASPRWNLTADLSATLRSFDGQPPPRGWYAFIDRMTSVFAKMRRAKEKVQSGSLFSDWTNTPPNTSLSTRVSMLSCVEGFGALAGLPVLAATNLPRPYLAIQGSFHSRDEVLKYVEAVMLTNGVRLEWGGKTIKALPAAEWDAYQKNPGSIELVPLQVYNMSAPNVEPRVLAWDYGTLQGKATYMAPNLPTNAVSFNSPNFEFLMVHEAVAGIKKVLTDAGITLIDANPRQIWAVSTADLARYQLPPVDVRPLSLVYTYSLIIALVCGTAGLPHILVRFYTNPDGVAAKRTTMWVMILIGVFYLFPPVVGVMGRNLLPQLYSAVGAKGTDKVVLELPSLLNQRVPGLGSVLSGVTCAGAFAAFMSTFSGLLVSMTGALAHDVYGRILRPSSTPAERMRAFKVCAVILGAIAVAAGMQVEKLDINFMVGQAFAIAAASYFPLLFLSVWWRGMTVKGAAWGMLGGGLLALGGISLTSFSDLKWIQMDALWSAHPLARILCEQPAIWAVPLAIALMLAISKLTRRDVPADVRMKMLVLHAPETLGLKQEYIQEHAVK